MATSASAEERRSGYLQQERVREQWLGEMASLRQRYQLPVIADRPAQGRFGGNYWR